MQALVYLENPDSVDCKCTSGIHAFPISKIHYTKSSAYQSYYPVPNTDLLRCAYSVSAVYLSFRSAHTLDRLHSKHKPLLIIKRPEHQCLRWPSYPHVFPVFHHSHASPDANDWNLSICPCAALSQTLHMHCLLSSTCRIKFPHWS